MDDPRSKLLKTRDVLTHRSGFPNWRTELADRRLAFRFDPGVKYQYCKFAVWMLGGAGLSKELFDEMASHQVQRR